MSSRLSLVQFCALLFAALSLVPAGAHLFEMPGKMSLTGDQYMIVQQIYAGWAWFGVPILLSILFAAWHAWLLRRSANGFLLASGAFVALLSALGVFWLWTYPMNVVTQNWTVTPPQFELVRAQWEYGHAAGAIATFAGFLLTVMAVLASRPAHPGPVEPVASSTSWQGRVPE